MSRRKLFTFALLIAVLVTSLGALVLGAVGSSNRSSGEDTLVIADGDPILTPTPTPEGERPTCGGTGGGCT